MPAKNPVSPDDRFYLSLRFSFPNMEHRFTLEGPVYFGPFDDALVAKATIADIIAAVRTMPKVHVEASPRFTRGRYEVVEDWVEPLRVIDRRLGIVSMSADEVADLERRVHHIIPVNDDRWREELPHIQGRLMERVLRFYQQRFSAA